MKAVLFVLVSALSMNAMALEISTSVKITQANQEQSEYKTIMLEGQEEAGVFLATSGQVVGPKFVRAVEVYRYVNRTSAEAEKIAEDMLKMKK